MNLAILTALVLSTGTPMQGLEALRADDLRVNTVFYRLATSSVAFCQNKGWQTGLLLHNLSQYAPAYRAAAIATFHLGEAPAVEGVVPGSAADRAGLRADDTLLSINGVPVQKEPIASHEASYAGMEALRRQLDDASGAGIFTLTVQRGTSSSQLTVRAEPGCLAYVQTLPEALKDAGADRRLVSISTAMVETTRNDDELAVLLAHELAHVALNHPAKLDALGVKRGLGRYFGRSAAAIRETESEADRLGLYLAARAGYDVTIAPAFLWRLGKAFGANLWSEPTHPALRDRVAAARETAERIKKGGIDAVTP